MKIRQGFVSNSSSTSFCIYGVCLDADKIADVLVAKGLVTAEECEDGFAEVLSNWSNTYILEKNGLTEKQAMDKCRENPLFEGDGWMSIRPPYDSDEYIGKYWPSIGDTETGGEFKAKIENKMKELFGDDVKCDTFEEAWRD